MSPERPADLPTHDRRSASEGARHPIDVHVGARLRLRRIQLGRSQEALAKAVGVSFQLVQKYEHGTIRMAASRLFEIGVALEVPVSFFFEGLAADAASARNRTTPDQRPQGAAADDRLSGREMLEITRAFLEIGNERTRATILGLVKSIAACR